MSSMSLRTTCSRFCAPEWCFREKFDQNAFFHEQHVSTDYLLTVLCPGAMFPWAIWSKCPLSMSNSPFWRCCSLPHDDRLWVWLCLHINIRTTYKAASKLKYFALLFFKPQKKKRKHACLINGKLSWIYAKAVIQWQGPQNPDALNIGRSGGHNEIHLISCTRARTPNNY